MATNFVDSSQANPQNWVDGGVQEVQVLLWIN